MIGEAGSGKTVLLQHLAAALATRHLGTSVEAALAAEAASEAGEVAFDAAALAKGVPLVPIPLVLEARELAASPDSTAPCAALRDVLAQKCPGCPGLDDLAAGIRAGRYWVLVDSLDEVPTGAGRAAVARILLGLRGMGASRVLLTSRPGAHTRAEVPAELRPLHIAALDDELRARMVDRWCRAQGLDAEARARLEAAVASLRSRFTSGPGDRPLEDNPLLLTCILLVFQEKQRLPENTADLYRRMVDILCETRKPRRDELHAARRSAAASAGAPPSAGVTAESEGDLARADSASVRLERAKAIATRFNPSLAPSGSETDFSYGEAAGRGARSLGRPITRPRKPGAAFRARRYRGGLSRGGLGRWAADRLGRADPS